MLIKALACLVLVFSIALFPPSAAHAASGMHSSIDTNHRHVNAVPPHHAAHNDATHHAEAAKDVQAQGGHSDAGSNQCCSGICLTAILIEGPILRVGQVSNSQYIVAPTRMTHVDPTGFLRPPKRLI